MARRRYQKGSVVLRNGNWSGRYLEDVRTADNVTRVHRRVFLGTVKDVPTRKLALRKLEPLLTPINSGDYQAKTLATLNEFLVRWEPLAMPKTETARNFRSALNKYLKPAFGKTQLSNIQTETLQRFISQTQTGGANMRNIIKCLRSIWKSAKAWGYVQHNPFQDLILPKIESSEQRFFTEAELKMIIDAAPEPFKTLYWILGQTGLRIGEVLALTWETLNLETGVVQVKNSVARGKLRENLTKTKAAKRVIPLSPRLLDHLALFEQRSTPNAHGLIFVNSKRNPWKAENLLEGHLQPLLDKLGIERAGFHAFRHASATILGRMDASVEQRIKRMGHTDQNMTQIYTHVVDEDARKIAAQFDDYILPEVAA